VIDMVGTFRWLEGVRSVGDYTEGRTFVLRKSGAVERGIRVVALRSEPGVGE
jgi:hypothetical protein